MRTTAAVVIDHSLRPEHEYVADHCHFIHFPFITNPNVGFVLTLIGIFC